ncbi:MAG TPA: anhydro-N-acetylmuramic acid kinase [Flavobacteriaceae bacterium]|nr:anhydro-N-acetylmuramic acid kinase [Flavobacteriaceae bacterium]
MKECKDTFSVVIIQFLFFKFTRLQDKTDLSKGILKATYHVVGVMSGTSLDGIDLVYCTLEKDQNWHYEIHFAETVSYTEYRKQSLRQAVQLQETQLNALDEDYTQYLATVINEFIGKCKQLPVFSGIDAVCSHGHTVLHQPEKGITFQMGNRQELATLIQHKVVCDFRKQDVALGGQGAPLVPIGDRLLFNKYDYCLNLGGFANVSFEEDGKRMAYDVCAVNVVLNALAEREGFAYDAEGKLAKLGVLLPELLQKLQDLQFYEQPPPKSLGIEWVRQHIFTLPEIHQYPPKDVLHTYTEHVARQLAAIFSEKTTVLITGGGAYNTYLLERLKAHKNLTILLPDNDLIEYKEALIFGLLGVLKLRGETNCLASVTGAEHSHSAGVVYNKH